jgi:putative spermidine/putrescine transport system permease protein
MAILVTITDALIALPFAFFIAKMAGRVARARRSSPCVFLPLWASYLAKVYAWINILSNHGVLPDLESHLGLPITNIGVHQYRDVDCLSVTSGYPS